ncbi:MAG: hypothetical protein A2054_02490 [Deltaproteobacteria bacterium GWA2_55_10]|nr:MAG: hypothetical protein A2054_02490 [Deltaproteobacteria bacterium GWA2_55_10]
MGKDAFLKLLVTQLENQDPLKPTDNTEFVAQLAQFSSLEGIQNLNSTMDGMANGISSLQDFSASGLIGRVVKAQTSQVEFDGTNALNLGYSLSTDAANVHLSIANPAGRIVRTIELGAQKAGSHELNWDGKDAGGVVLPAGAYTLSATAQDAKGVHIDAGTELIGYVTGVSMQDSKIFVNGTAVNKDSVKEIY